MNANEAAYLSRQRRLEDAIALRKPDRVPVAPLASHFYHTRVAAVSNKDAMRDYARAFGAAKDLTLALDFDVAVQSAVIPSRFWEILGLTQFKWPGGVLKDDEPFQFAGGEALKAAQYDEFLKDPSGFTVQKIWPQISTTLAPLGQLPLPPLYELSSAYNLSFMLPGIVSIPPVMHMLKSLVAVGEEFMTFQGAAAGYGAEMAALGYPACFGGITETAFDWVGDFLRGMRGALMDMLRNRAKLLDLIDTLIPSTIHQGIVSAKMAGNPRVFIPLHWCADGFMSNDQYARFYWPSLRALLLGLIDAGLTPIPFFEGECNTRLEFLKELPAGRVVGHFDIVDRPKAKKIIGDTMCFWGNVPAALLATGTPQQVKDDVKELIDIFGDNGGLIIDGSVGLPDEARPENVAAMVDAVHEYGSTSATKLIQV